MYSRMHFISGLPRSGSTLLSAILKQNPRFSAAMTSPVAALVQGIHSPMCGGEFAPFFNDTNRGRIMRGLFNSYYHDSPPVAFDTNRSWTSRLPLLTAMFPKSRMICCVRELSWVVDSLERQLTKNPLQLSMMYGYKPGSSVYSRIELLMNSDTGLIGAPWSGLNEAWFGEHAKRMIIVPYESLAKDPLKVMTRLYQEIEEPWFEHDFDNVEYSASEFDEHIGMPGLHDVKRKVEFVQREPIIPIDLYQKYINTAFWNAPDLNPRGVLVL